MFQNIAYFTLLLIYRTYIYLKTCVFQYWQGFDIYTHLLVLNLVPLRKSCSLKHSCVYASRSDDWLVLKRSTYFKTPLSRPDLFSWPLLKHFVSGCRELYTNESTSYKFVVHKKIFLLIQSRQIFFIQIEIQI